MKTTLGISGTDLGSFEPTQTLIPRNDSLFMMSEELNEMLDSKKGTINESIENAWTCNVRLLNVDLTVEGAVLEVKNEPGSNDWFTIKFRVDAARGMNFFLHASTNTVQVFEVEFMSSSGLFTFKPRQHSLATSIDSFDPVNGLATLTLILRT